MQVLAPGVVENLPAAQSEHEVWPLSDAKLPGSQLLHTVEPGAFVKLPGPQLEQLL